MMMNETYFLYALVAANAFFAAIVCITLLRLAWRLAEFETLLAQPAVPAAADENVESMRCTQQSLERLDGRIAELQRALQALSKKSSERRAAPLRQLPIENAVRMARQGASVDDLTRNCGLNIGEARLMQRLHGQAQMVAAGN